MQPPTKAPRILCLQQSSIFEGYGGAEYYMDDLLTAAGKLLGGGNVRSLVPKRTDKFQLSPKSYGVEAVQFKRKGILRKIENRYSADFFWTAMATIHEFQPTLLLAAHVSLAPLTYALSKLTRTPYFTIALGIETWGGLWPQDAFALKHSNGIISISEWTKNVLVKQGYNPKRFHIIHPTLNETFEKVPEPAFNKNATGPLRLLTISRLDAQEQYKGHDHVIQAIHLLKKENPALQLNYTILGDGNDRSRLENLVKELDLTPIVTFKGALKDRNALESIYKEADVFIMPSRFGKWAGKWRGEGFGIVYVEAGIFGVPSIAYNCGGVTDIIESGKNGILVPPDDIASLAAAIRQTYQNRETIIAMGKSARQTAKEKFSPKAMYKEIATFFQEAFRVELNLPTLG